MNNNSSGGIGVFGIVQIIFIILKLTGLIAWSWGVVLIPLWIDLALVLLLMMIIGSR